MEGKRKACAPETHGEGR